MIEVFNVILMGFMVVIACAVIRMKDLFGITILMGIFSLLSAGWLTVMDAVDVAFTEAAVGAGISTVLVLGTLALVPTVERGKDHPDWLGITVALVVGVVLIYSTFDMPVYGDPNAPIHTYLAPRFIQDSPQEIGVPNIVTSVLASYRGYDTMGETTVVFTAAIGVAFLLGGGLRRSQVREEEEEE